MSERDVIYLEEYKEVFKHRSRVKKLAISFAFIASPSGTKNRQWKANDQKSGLSKIEKEQSILNLLLVTKRLEAFEINTIPSLEEGLNVEDIPNFTNSLTSLSSSQPSLKHLRSFAALEASSSLIYHFGLESLKQLKVLSIDTNGLLYFTEQNLNPLNVEILWLSWYSEFPQDYGEDSYPDFKMLTSIIEHTLPKLKMLIIPQNPINSANHVDESAARRAIWAKKKEDFLSREIFTSGKIEVFEFEAA